jgi:integrase/recombinase XerC
MSGAKRYQLTPTKYLSTTEVDRLRYLLKSHVDVDRRNCLLILLALHTGARASELLLIRRQDINEAEESVFLRGLKGSNDREIPLPTWVYKHLSRWLHEPTATVRSERIFAMSYSRLRQVWDLYRPVPKTFHALRHTFAIELYKKTRDIRLVQVALGHRSIMNTMIYADYVYSIEELRKQLL